MKISSEKIVVRALKSTQANTDIFAFFMPGKDILKIASISRISRDENEKLLGFQRKEIRNHVKSIIEFLDRGSVLFPNALILALSPKVEFVQSRGPQPTGVINNSCSGTLRIPIQESGKQVAWIVDGQQRSLALSKTKNDEIPVPVIAFVSENLDIQREQFILVNKARPLSSRLINELLPEVSAYIPSDLSPRKIPSELCNILNASKESPFYKLIKRTTGEKLGAAVVTDTALINIMRRSIRHPLGALAPFRVGDDGSPNVDAMYNTMLLFWNAVRDTFPDAWGKQPSESRLMHSAGLEAMGYLMDRIMTRVYGSGDADKIIRESLSKMAPNCAWTKGAWKDTSVKWNEIQNTPRHIKFLTELLIQYDYQGMRAI